MAELADVEQALVDAIISSAYPSGADKISALGVAWRIYRGQPTNATLAIDRTTGTVDVSVCPLANATKNTTRWGVQIANLSCAPSLTVTVSGNSATFFGIAASGDIAGVLVNQQAYTYQAQAGDAAGLVAAALADAIRTSTICWLVGSTITVPGAVHFTARSVSGVSTLEECCRQEQRFQVAIWAPTPFVRDLVAKAIIGSLAQISFLSLADGTGGRLRYHSTANHDGDQAASIYRRDLNYDVEYGTTIAGINPTMLFGDLDFNGTTIYA
jgi:hypothetical protein